MTAIKINGQEFPPEIVQKMIEAGIPITKNDPSSQTPTNDPLYGPYPSGSGKYGLLSVPGVRPDMWSTHVDVEPGLAGLLGLTPSVYESEKIGILTGVQDATGTNATAFCTVAGPTPAALKRCVQNFIFGKLQYRTKIFCTDEQGLRRDYSDMDKTIINLRRNPNPFVPDAVFRADLNNRAGRDLAAELFALGVSISRSNELVMIRGNTATASTATEDGWIREFSGLTQQITTGHTDLDTDVACPSADSEVVAFNASISGTTADGRDLMQVMTDMFWTKKDLARKLGMDGTMWAWMMHPRLFREITYIWACNYASYRCTGTAGNPQNENALETRRLQLEMFDGKFLLVDGMRVPVILTEGMPDDRAGDGIFTGDLFLVPLMWAGRRLLHMEYKPMNNPEAMAVSEAFGIASLSTFMNNGLYKVDKLERAGAVEFIFKSMMRLILETPFLAGRVDDISYTFLADAWRSALPSDTTYWQDGGATYFAASSPS